jgi:hypothetical protein
MAENLRVLIPSVALTVSLTDGVAVPQRTEQAVRAALVAMGAVTTLPVLALASPAVLRWSYGISAPDGMTLALLQHRGVLQLLLGAAIAGAAFHRPVRVAVALGAAASKATFLLLILPDPALRADLALLSTVFDATCIVLLAAIAARELGRDRAAA